MQVALAKASYRLAAFPEFLAWILAMPPGPIEKKARPKECPRVDPSRLAIRNAYSYRESGCGANKKTAPLSPVRNSRLPCDMPVPWRGNMIALRFRRHERKGPSLRSKRKNAHQNPLSHRKACGVLTRKRPSPDLLPLTVRDPMFQESALEIDLETSGPGQAFEKSTWRPWEIG